MFEIPFWFGIALGVWLGIYVELHRTNSLVEKEIEAFKKKHRLLDNLHKPPVSFGNFN